MNSLLAISGNVRCVARYGSSRSSAPVRLIAQAPSGPEVAATRSRSSRASSTREPRSRAQLEHPLGLGENRAGRAGLAEREMGAGELEPDLDGQPGNAVVEQRPQTVRARQRRARVLLPAPRGARRVPSRRARARSTSSRRGPPPRRAPVPPRARSPRLAPGSLLGGEERELRLCDDRPPRRRPPASPASMAAVRSLRRAIGRAEQRMRDAPGEERGRDSSRCRAGADRAPGRRRRAPARRRPASCAPAGWRPRARSWRCRPRAGSPRSPRRRERATARPPRAAPSARGPRLRRRRARGIARSSSSPNHPSHSSTVSIRPS